MPSSIMLIFTSKAQEKQEERKYHDATQYLIFSFKFSCQLKVFTNVISIENTVQESFSLILFFCKIPRQKNTSSWFIKLILLQRG